MVLVRSSVGENLVVSLSVFTRWYHEYASPGRVAFGRRRPSPEDEAKGVEDIIEIYHVDDADPKDVPPELRDMFK